MAHPGILSVSGVVRLAGILLGLAVLVGAPGLASAAKGPWRGQVLDAETKQPLEGVVVLAYWYRYRFHLSQLVLGGHQTPEFFDAVEAVTDAQGRWEIPKKSFPFFANIGVFFRYFKPGYGRWHYAGQGTAEWLELPVEEQMRRSKEMALAVWTEEGSKVELLPARTREEQVKMESFPTFVPLSKTPLTLEAINKARIAVGLPPVGPPVQERR